MSRLVKPREAVVREGVPEEIVHAWAKSKRQKDGGSTRTWYRSGGTCGTCMELQVAPWGGM